MDLLFLARKAGLDGFPAIGAAWRMTEENFMKDSKWLTELKLRGSWGKTGFDGNTPPNNQYTLYGSGPGFSYYDINGISSGNIQPGLAQVSMGQCTHKLAERCSNKYWIGCCFVEWEIWNHSRRGIIKIQPGYYSRLSCPVCWVEQRRQM